MKLRKVDLLLCAKGTLHPRTAGLSFVAIICFLVALSGFAQVPRKTQPRRETQTAQPSPAPTPPETQQPAETLRTDTNLVTVPIIASDPEGRYVPDLKQEEFSISEDGVPQKIAFFHTVNAPFHMILMIDTSGSTQEKLGQIQRAAVAFVEQLQPADRLKVISFDNEIRDLNEFTNDRNVLKAAILKTRPGAGTKLYDAFAQALDSIRRIQGRKAIVLFTDGVDYHSDEATFDSTLRGLDEEGVIVYPIRFDTRDETERIARGQAEDQGVVQLPTIGVIRRPPNGTTAPTFPSDDPSTVPTSGTRGNTGILGLPSPAEIIRRTNDPNRTDPNRGGYPPDSRDPGPPTRTDPLPQRTDPIPGSRSDPNPGSRTDPNGTTRTRRYPDDSISTMLNALYLTADSYLKELADKSGGRVLRADTLASLPDAFVKIAAELRTQYSIGYYPANEARDGQYRKIKVSTTRKNVVVRTRPGYRTPSN